MIDGGDNGGICNEKDMCLTFYHLDDKHVNISGVGNHAINYRRLATVCAVIMTHIDLRLRIHHNYADAPEHKGTIHSHL